MEFSILGPLEMRSEGRVVPLGGTKQRALLAILLLNANEVVARDRLIEGVWGARPPATASHTLDSYVSRIRKLLATSGAEQRLLTRPPGYLLRIDPSELDLHRFNEAAAQGRAALGEGRAADAVELFDRGLGLFRGSPLDDLVFFPFASVHVDQIEEARLLALEDRMEAALSAGEAAGLVPELEALVAAYPLRERFGGQLMLALYRGGRQVEALATYRRHRAYLADELGVAPGVALRDLEHLMLVQHPGLEGPQRRRADAVGPAPGARDTRGRRRRTWLAVAVVCLLVAAASITLVTGVRTGEASPHLELPHRGLGRLDAGTGTLDARIELGARPGAMAVGPGGVWVSRLGEQSIAQVDRGSSVVTRVIPLGGEATGIAMGAGSVWVALLDGRVAQLAPDSGDLQRMTDVGDEASGIAYGSGMVWVADPRGRQVVGLDPRSGSVAQRVPLETSPTELAFGAGALWVTSQPAGLVYRIDPSGADPQRIAVGNGPSDVEATDAAVWVTNTLDGTVSRIDAGTTAVSATTRVGPSPVGVAVVRNDVWVADGSSGEVAQLDAGTLQVTRRIHAGPGSGALAVDGDAVWFGAGTSEEAHRGGTLRIAAAVPGVDSIDPATSVMLTPPQLLGMTNDGLVTLAHVPGGAGTRLVPDLAQSLPVPTNHGRVYRFGLRSGIRYSTGAEVQPDDFRRAIERAFDLGAANAPLFSAVVGAQRCARAREHCDLSRGVVVDRAVGAVTFHLTRADPDFLYKLALPVAAAVPWGTPRTDVGVSPVPATGPYRIADYRPGRSLVLVRNPMFRVWSSAAQPAGYPDRIVWKLGLTDREVVSRIGSGASDWGVYSFPFAPPGAQVVRILTTHATQVQVDPLPETEFFALRVGVPPFDDIRVRRALNYAIDRNTLVSMYGGRALATPTCQVLPPSVPGHRRYCPYTLQPTGSGRYRAPRPVLARRLVAESGTRGMRVEVLTDPGFPPATYVVSVLRSLGYRASLRIARGSEFERLSTDPHSGIQMIRGGWTADYPSASDFLGLLLSCPIGDHTLNAGRFCDRSVDRRMRAASRLAESRPAAANRQWARLDHELTDRAVWLPTVNLNAVGFVSARAGDYQFHPQWGLLVDQLWVR